MCDVGDEQWWCAWSYNAQLCQLAMRSRYRYFLLLFYLRLVEAVTIRIKNDERIGVTHS